MAVEGIKGGSAAELTARHLEDLILERLAPPRRTVAAGARDGASAQGITADAAPGDEDARGERPVAGGAWCASCRAAGDEHHRPADRIRPLRERGGRRLSRAAPDARGPGRDACRDAANHADRATLRRCMERIDAAHEKADPHDEADADVDLHVAIYEASHNIVLLQVMRALSGMLRRGVLQPGEALCQVRGARGPAEPTPVDLRGRDGAGPGSRRPHRRGSHDLHAASVARDRRGRGPARDFPSANRRRQPQFPGLDKAGAKGRLRSRWPIFEVLPKTWIPGAVAPQRTAASALVADLGWAPVNGGCPPLRAVPDQLHRSQLLRSSWHTPSV